MKKNVIALLLAVVMVSSSVGAVPVLAAETVEPEEVAEEEETVEDAADTEDADTGETVNEAAEGESTEVIEEEPEQGATEGAEEAETTEEVETVEEEEGTDSADIADTSAEVAEVEEPAEDAEVEETETEDKDAALADAEDIVDSGTCGENVTWTLTGTDNDLTLIISGSGNACSFNDPSYAPWASKRSKIKTVVVEDGITKLGQYAFYSLNKTTSVILPESLLRIERNAFENCASLTSITIPSGVTSIENLAFEGCYKLKEVYTNSLESWMNIEKDYTGLQGYDLYINNSLLTSLTIPSNITYIGEYAFLGCRSLTSITIPDGVTEIGNSAFEDCTNLSSISIPDSVVSTGYRVFYGCSNLKSIIIPDGLTEINSMLFEDCSSLESVTIGNNIQNIKAEAFMNCTSLKKLIIPNSVILIGSRSFGGCINLERLVFPNDIVIIEDYAFLGCDNLMSVTIPDSIASIGQYAFGWENWQSPGVTILFRGTKAQWDAAVGNNEVYYKSIVYNYFSVDADFKLSGTSFNYTGKPIKPTVTVTYDGQQLVEGTDYELVYKNNTNAGKASVDINGIGEYSGTASKTFTIKKAPNTITAKSFTRTYSTKAQTFDLGVKIKNGTPTYKSNSKSVTVSKAGKITVKAKFIGKATITITAPASTNYTATTKKIAITVNPTKTALSNVTSPSAGKMTVKWKKNAVGTGYQIQYSTSSKFTSPKSVTITKNSTLTRTIGSLVKGKKYYVRIRTYKTVGSVKFYSGWSAAKAVTVKK